MFSFSKIATFALFALGAAASAIPVKQDQPGSPAPQGPPGAPSQQGPPGFPAHKGPGRPGTNAVDILETLASEVAPIAAQFGGYTALHSVAFRLQNSSLSANLTAENATATNVQFIVDEIDTLVSKAASELAALPAGPRFEGGNSTEALAHVFTVCATS